MAVTSIIALSTLGNTVELSTGDLRSNKVFDGIKASFNQALKIGNMSPSNLACEYDSNANRDFLSKASLSGALTENKELSVDYEVEHEFASKTTSTKVTASTNLDGTKFSAELNGGDITEVSASRDLDVGDESLNVNPSWLVKAKTARVKLMSKVGGGDRVSAQVDYTPDGGNTAYEVTYDHNLEDGRDISATIGSGSGAVEIDYVDSKSEDGATWTASASVPYEGGTSNMMDAAKLSLKRSWKW